MINKKIINKENVSYRHIQLMKEQVLSFDNSNEYRFHLRYNKLAKNALKESGLNLHVYEKIFKMISSDNFVSDGDFVAQVILIIEDEVSETGMGLEMSKITNLMGTSLNLTYNSIVVDFIYELFVLTSVAQLINLDYAIKNNNLNPVCVAATIFTMRLLYDIHNASTDIRQTKSGEIVRLLHHSLMITQSKIGMLVLDSNEERRLDMEKRIANVDNGQYEIPRDFKDCITNVSFDDLFSLMK